MIENYTVSRELSFYADKMNLSSKYLSQVVLSVTGRSAFGVDLRYTICHQDVPAKFLSRYQRDSRIGRFLQSNMSVISNITRTCRPLSTGTTCGQYDPEQ